MSSISIIDGEETMSYDRVMYGGQVLGAREMLTKSTHKRIMRARGHVEVLALSYADLIEVLRQFPDVYQSVHKYALRNYKYNLIMI